MKITNHAILRYQERIAAVGIGEARRRILEHETVLTIAADFGAPVVRNSDGVRFVIKNGAVVTVLAPGMPIGRAQ